MALVAEHRGAFGHRLVGIEQADVADGGKLLLQAVLHLGHVGRPAHQQYLVDVVSALGLRLLEDALREHDGVLEPAVGDRVELIPRHLHSRTIRSMGHSCRVLRLRGQRPLRRFGQVEQLLPRLVRVHQFADLRAMFLGELPGEPRRDVLVPVGAAEVVVAVDADDLDVARVHFDDGDVERAAAEVVDEHRLGPRRVLAHAVEDGRRGRFRDHVADVQPGDLTSLARGLLLREAEVGGAGNDDVLDRFFLARVVLGVLDQLAQDMGGDLLRTEWRVGDSGKPHVLLAHASLDQRDDPFRTRLQLLLRGLADDHVPRVLEEDDRRCREVAVGVGNDFGFAGVVDVGDAGVRGSQVDAEYAVLLVAARHPSLPLDAGGTVRRRPPSLRRRQQFTPVMNPTATAGSGTPRRAP